MIELLKKIYQSVNNRQIHGYSASMPIRKQIDFFNSFPTPKNDYERSYYKYICFCKYCYYKKLWKIKIYNAICFFIYYPAKMFFQNRSHYNNNVIIYDAVIQNSPSLPNKDIIPKELLDRYNNYIEIKEFDYNNIFLDDEAIEILSVLDKQFPNEYYFRFINMIKLGLFCYYYAKYKSKAIILYSREREFTSPIQFLYCEKRRIKYISFMHGDYFFQLCFAFQKYHYYYLWDKSYNNMFKNIGCVYTERLYFPDKLKLTISCNNNQTPNFFATYYLSGEGVYQMKSICASLRVFETNGLKCKVRPHPRFKDMNLISSIFKEFKIEDIDNISLVDSLSDTTYVIGLNTTVLLQASYANMNIVIDDCSNKSEFNELKLKSFSVFSKKHILLSELIKKTYS